MKTTRWIEGDIGDGPRLLLRIIPDSAKPRPYFPGHAVSLHRTVAAQIVRLWREEGMPGRQPGFPAAIMVAVGHLASRSFEEMERRAA